MAIQKILLPYNFTSLDQKALDFVINVFSHLKDTEITILNAYTSGSWTRIALPSLFVSLPFSYHKLVDLKTRQKILIEKIHKSM